jgi:cupin 2 domain-containing protein
MQSPQSLLKPVESPDEGEIFSTLLERPGLKIERIESRGCASPEGFWYEQAHEEWVLLLRGSAVLAFEYEADVRLVGGDSWLIPARMRHRVVEVSGDALWLAVHVG